jgi:hypothetical protein
MESRITIMDEAKQATAKVPRKINIVLNWFEELKERVPAK